MSGRSRSSFTKRQKERSRQEKQREKAERKVQRRLEKQSGGPSEEHGESFEDTIDSAAVEEQLALPGSGSDE